jgi:RNase adaptor protein for sRNA GlmZ degradation
MTGSKTPKLNYGYGNSTHGNHIRLDTYENNRRAHKSVHQGDSILDNDSDSERAILEDAEGKGAGIVKTTKVSVTEADDIESPKTSQQRSREWEASNDTERGEHHAR